MALQITSDTVVKIIVRRGQELDRAQTLLSEGELGYSTDIRRLFVGDGISLGGFPVGQQFFGWVANKNGYTTKAQDGDALFQTTNNVLYGYDALTDAWRSLHPTFGTGFEHNAQTWDISRYVVAPGFGYDPYEPAVGSNTLNDGAKFSITGKPGVIDFNSYFMSLCSTAPIEGSSYTGSVYFGNVHNRTVKNNFDARVNIDNRLYINGTDVNPNQIQILAKDAAGNSCIEVMSGKFVAKSPSIMDIFSQQNKLISINSGSNLTYVPIATGSYTTPNFFINGLSRFGYHTYFDRDVNISNNLGIGNDLTVTGNLSVYGRIGYFDSYVTSTSALSVLAYNADVNALEVLHYSTNPDANVAKFDSRKSIDPTRPDYTGRSVMTIKDGPYVGINVAPNRNYTNTNNAVLHLSGSVAIGCDPLQGGIDRFRVDTGIGGITLNAQQDVHAGPFSSLVSNIGFTTIGNTAVSDKGHALFNILGITTFTQTGSPVDNKFVSIITNKTTSVNTGLEIIGSTSDVRSIKFFPDGKLNNNSLLVKDRDSAIIFGANADSDPTGFVLAPWNTNVPVGLRIDSNGYVGLNNNSSTYKTHLDVTGAGNFTGNLTVSGRVVVGSTLLTKGTIYALNSDVIAFYTSDKNLKKNITIIDSALDKIDKISGVNFVWDDEKQDVHTGKDIGVIAQEIEAIIPEAVTTRENGYKAVKYDKIIPLLIEAIKELKRQIK